MFKVERRADARTLRWNRCGTFEDQNKPRIAEAQRLAGESVNFDWKQAQDYEEREQCKVSTFYV